MKWIAVFFVIVILSVCHTAYGQSVDVQNTYKVSGKAKKGELARIFYNEDDKTTSLVYVTKLNNRKIKYQVYSFDKNYKFIKMEEVEEEFEKYNKKFKLQIKLPKWQREFEGQESFTKEYVSAYRNVAGNLVLYKDQATYKWKHRFNRFVQTNVKTIEKVKPKVADNVKYAIKSWAFNYDKQQLFCVTQNGYRDADPNIFQIVLFNTDFEVDKTTEIDLGEPSTLVSSIVVPKKGTKVKGVANRNIINLPENATSASINPALFYANFAGALANAFKNKPAYDFGNFVFEDDEQMYEFEDNEVVLIFANNAGLNQTIPYKDKDKVGFEFKPVKYTLVRLTNTGEIIERKELTGFDQYFNNALSANAQRGAEAAAATDPVFDIGGVLMTLVDDDLFMYFEADISPNTKLWSSNGDKYEGSDRSKVHYNFIKLESISEVAWAKTYLSTDLQSIAFKEMEYDMKHAQKTNTLLPGLQTIYLGEQYHFLSGSRYHHGMGILTDADGNLKGNYQLIAGTKKMFDKKKPDAVFQSGLPTIMNGNNLYWFMMENATAVKDKQQVLTNNITPRLTRIDMASGKLVETKKYGQYSKKEQFFLNTAFPIVPQSKPGSVTFFGERKGGKFIWFCRVNLDS